MRLRLKITIFILFLISVSSSGSYLNAASLTTASDITINLNDSTLNIDDISNAGTLLTSSGSINLGGNWTNTGTFSGGASGVVKFSGLGVSTVRGNNSFTNFICTQAGKQLNFESGKTQTISSAWTLTGSSGNLVKLRSTTTGLQWNVNPTGTKNISFVDVQDSNNLNTLIINPANSTNSGNNTNWFSSVAIPTPTLTPTTIVTPTPASTTTPVVTVTPTPLPTAQPGVTPTPTPGSGSVKADFVAEPRLGTAPLEVQFTDKSTGNINSWLWDFGDGASSSDQNPTNLYTSPGLYDVTLTVSGTIGQDTKEERRLIDVRSAADLVADFSVLATTGLVPFTAEFTDQSKNGPNAWLWGFGDSGQSSEQNPTHTYENAGIFTVSLTVSNSTDTDTIIKQNLINVEAVNVVADFKALPVVGFPSLKVEFTDLSEPEDDLVSWLWEFGDGANSTEQSPNHEYDIEGFYTVKLTISSFSGEVEVKVKTNLIIIKAVGTPLAEFKASPTVVKAPATVRFTDLSEPANDISSWIWDFGDGAISAEQNPEHEYKNEGINTVRLTVSNSSGADSEVKTNLIGVQVSDSPVAEFSASPTAGREPLKVTFTDNSAGEDINSWLWDFGDGGQDVKQNTTHVYNTTGIYNVKLIVSSSSGSDNETKNNLINVVAMNEPAADFSAEAIMIEKAPFEVLFIDNSIGDITLWEWDFGDGATNSGQEQTPMHTYQKKGEFNVKLKVTSGNFTDTVEKTNFITVHEEGSGEPGQILTELDAEPKTIPRSKETTTVTVLARDQNDNPMKDVIINAQASGRKAIVSPSSALTDVDGNANFEVKFVTFRKISKVTFTADGFTTIVNQN